ncbi:tetratricopeptide repeat protein [uncultured Methanobrevibacter sp.]|uniref:tetratricopeptide repeat protein n=1 Tax=uncultured Methanobrevibacter sp. TaxID=253161 RepID=UPI0025CF2F00|nr:tetratricopeptide repeat protein [uncultured Methanobrevibacter sp.]
MVNLNNAKKLYSQKKYEESLEIYENLFEKDPDSFTKENLISYSWAIYQVHVKNFKDEDELFDATDLITELIPQSDLNRTKICPYTFSVFKVLEYLMDKKEFYNMSEWLDLLEAKRLDENDSKYSKSRKELYYEYASKSSLECAEWEACIEISADALKTIKTFAKDGDVWHKWRIAKAYREMKDYEKALEFLREVAKSKNEWFIFREFAENYCLLGDLRNALKYVRPAILAKGHLK